MPLDTIRDVREAVTAAEEAKEILAGRELWWRGHAQSEWTLVPKLFRPPSRAAVEHHMVITFQLRALSRRKDCPSEKDHPAWLYLMQHYGLPTRLLDWTESILTALFFAVEDERRDEKPGALWAMNPLLLNKARTGEALLVLPEHVPHLFDDAFRSTPATAPMVAAVAPAEVDLRLMMQVAGFTIHSVGTPLEDMPDYGVPLRKYAIPADAKKHIRQQLDLIGIRRANLFPDLENLAKEIDDSSVDLVRS